MTEEQRSLMRRVYDHWIREHAPLRVPICEPSLGLRSSGILVEVGRSRNRMYKWFGLTMRGLGHALPHSALLDKGRAGAVAS